ncbi:hypothetical protein KIN20_000894 [Parelaphostrongylus tenuis]|uniref:Uncharacterized protein n=1 Tax=Parelaphostrongylus tenuis TaxID=148309 RepID=A0AAD5ME00_PARTN|nr:hypothetical protein KIN20_000894 [Parelaphostrongylus tenuis]
MGNTLYDTGRCAYEYFDANLLEIYNPGLLACTSTRRFIREPEIDMGTMTKQYVVVLLYTNRQYLQNV